MNIKLGIGSLIDEAIELASNPYNGAGIGMSSAAHNCWRRIWYDLHWADGVPQFNAQVLRIFETGNIYEDRLLDWLEAAEGVRVKRFEDNGKQMRAVLADGFLRGYLDGRVLGLPEAPKTPHVVECKSHNDKSFKEVMKKGVKTAKPDHYAQMQAYMQATGDKRALYLAVNKNDDHIYTERIEHDVEYCIQLEEKCRAIAKSSEAPPPLHKDPDSRGALDCMFCNHKTMCKGETFPKTTTCRTCAFVTKIPDGNATWHCDRFDKPLSYNDQKEGCGAHLYNPDLIPGEVVKYDDEKHTIEYKLNDGRTWTDGNIAGEF